MTAAISAMRRRRNNLDIAVLAVGDIEVMQA
jgi:hypothetical protein